MSVNCAYIDLYIFAAVLASCFYFFEPLLFKIKTTVLFLYKQYKKFFKHQPDKVSDFIHKLRRRAYMKKYQIKCKKNSKYKFSSYFSKTFQCLKEHHVYLLE